MRKIFVLVLVLLILPFMSATQISMNSNYSQGETLIAQISGNFLTQIQQQNIFLYDGHVRVSFIPYVQKLGDSFYVYGQLSGKSPGNYSLVLTGVRYIESGSAKSDNIVQNFTITDSSSDFLISPGFIESQGTFKISAQNLIGSTIDVESFLQNVTSLPSGSGSNQGFFASLLESSNSDSNAKLTSVSGTTIVSGQTKQIFFSVNSSEQDEMVYAILRTNNTFYSVPIFIPSNSTSKTFQLPLSFQPNQEVLSMPTNSNLSAYVSLFNSGLQTMNVSLTLSNSINSYVSIPAQVTVRSNSSVLIPFNITSGSSENFIEGQITATSPNSTAYFALMLNFSRGYVAPQNVTLFQTCSQLGGIFCSDTESCNVQTQNAEDGICCIGTCEKVQKNNAGAIIGWTLAAIIIGFVAFFFIRRYRKAKRRPLNLLDFAKRKSG